MAHPLHGTKPLADKLGKRCDWGTPSGLYFFKLERTEGRRRIVNTEVGRFMASARMVDNRRVPGPDAVQLASRFPGWELVFA